MSVGGLVSTSRAAREVGKTPQTLRRWAEMGVLAAVRTADGRFLFFLPDVRACAKRVEEVKKWLKK